MIDIDNILFWVAIIITIADLIAICIGIYKWITDKNNKSKWGILTVGAFVVALVLGVVIGLQFRPQDGIVVDNFEYENHKVLENTWHRLGSEGSVTNLQLENDSAPGVPGTQSVRVATDVPCLGPDRPDRFQRIERIFPDPDQDWSDSNLLEFWVKGDGVSVPARCQLSVFLIETNGELWQSTQYFDRLNSWEKMTIHLVGNGKPGNAAAHPEDFVVPWWAADRAEDTSDEPVLQLDLERIERIGIEVITERDWACGPLEEEPEQVFPDCSVMLDHIVRR
jgi:hypothetical protein